MAEQITYRRVYEETAPKEGKRVLVDLLSVTRVRLGCLGRRWDATKASSFFLEPPTGLWGIGSPAPCTSRTRRFLRCHPGWVINRAKVRGPTLVTIL
ncbi:hypothetical protein SAMN02745898_1011275 [Streptomyces sp. 136MFCol5.1]|nr:hypothetical protein SAMN02745898_1011275 [Streptomyces sp. 136MFCol5.1]